MSVFLESSKEWANRNVQRLQRICAMAYFRWSQAIMYFKQKSIVRVLILLVVYNRKICIPISVYQKNALETSIPVSLKAMNVFLCILAITRFVFEFLGKNKLFQQMVVLIP